MKILVTGSQGLLGPFLIEELGRLGEVVSSPRSRCDLRDRAATSRMIREVAPDVVVHAAAYADVDGCEHDPSRAKLDNVESARNVAGACNDDVQVILTSTDQVYPDTSGPHAEPDVGPVNVYGRTKLEAESVVLQHPRALVLRCNFFAASRTPGRASLSDVIVQSLAAGRTFPGFTDSAFSPLHARTLATHIAGAITDDVGGLFNIGSREGASKAQFARLVARHLEMDERLIEDMQSAALPGRAPRPHDLRMDVGGYTLATHRTLPTLEHEVQLL